MVRLRLEPLLDLVANFIELFSIVNTRTFDPGNSVGSLADSSGHLTFLLWQLTGLFIPLGVFKTRRTFDNFRDCIRIIRIEVSYIN